MNPAQRPPARHEAVQAHFIAACELDVDAIKPGNVRRDSPAHGMSAQDFINSAHVCAADLCSPGASVGARVLEAIRSTRRVVQCNTNLGIVLLAAPLCAAAFAGGTLQAAVQAQLAALDESDAGQVYEAIRLARPGGLGRVEAHDVADEPRVGLLEAMIAAAARDSVARQYAEGFGDVFAWGLPHWQSALDRCGDERAATSAVFLAFLSRWPDSLIERKFGTATAQAVSERAGHLHRQWLSQGHADEMRQALLSWDEQLKAAGLNPGTSADLTVASVLAAKLMRAV